MMRAVRIVIFLCAAALAVQAQDTTARVRAWRVQHEQQILDELFDFLAIPNVADKPDDIQKNVEALTRMFERRRFAPDAVATGGSPVVLAERRAPNLRRTITFYFHYDGQPVVAREWINAPPFTPKIVGDRLYARSASDDKSPIVTLLAAIDALDAANIPLTSNIRVLMEGEEEAGSPNLEAAMRRYGDRIRGDVLLLVDGP